MSARPPLRAALAGGAALALVVVAVGCSGPSRRSVTPVVEPAVAGPTATSSPDPAAADAAKGFLRSLSDGRYDDMWDMLAAAPRAFWGASDPFGAFLDRKFGSLDLSFDIGTPATAADWRDPESGAQYPLAVTVPITLRVAGRVAPEFSLAPLALVQENGHWRVAGVGPAARRAPAVFPPPASTAALSVPTLVYHHVSQETPADFEQRTITVASAAFEDQLAYLQQSGYHTITTAELANALFYGLPLPDKPVLLTFDDGYQDAFTDAFPILQRYGFSGVFALITGFVGGAGYLTWDQVQSMSGAGMEFVSHTVHHVDLGSVPAEAAGDELRQSRADLEAHLGRPVQVLVYPYGEPFAHGTPEQQQAIVQLLRQEAYVAAFANPLPNSPPDITQHADLPYQLARVMVSGGLPLNRFAARLEGSDLQ
ncbi:MAG TPA: polysaccharide deacetylase family protein [Dehalococcoidia bacterium]|nr:polysaccharide deacetylase family protein [Dehalococcoidia bacterium]